jgi:lactoylglutathione lyase
LLDGALAQIDAAAPRSKPWPAQAWAMLERRLGGVERAKLVGINHVALEVGDVEEALEFYGRFLEFELRGRGGGMTFIDMGDQFIALARGREAGPDQARHFGLVVDDKELVRRALQAAGVPVQASGSLDFRDPWGNNIQVVDYREIQFTKADHVLSAMGLDGLQKTEGALEELRAKGLARD